MRRLTSLLVSVTLIGSLCGCPGSEPAPAADTAAIGSQRSAEVASAVEAAPEVSGVSDPVVREPAPQPLAMLLPEVRPTPEAPAQVLGARPAELEQWIASPEVAPEVRYTALRQLEEHDPAAAVELAATLVHEEPGVLRTNAIALLARSSDPRAAAALEGLDARGQRLAQLLAERGN